MGEGSEEHIREAPRYAAATVSSSCSPQWQSTYNTLAYNEVFVPAWRWWCFVGTLNKSTLLLLLCLAQDMTTRTHQQGQGMAHRHTGIGTGTQRLPQEQNTHIWGAQKRK